MSKRYQVVNQMNQVLLDNVSVDDATRYAYQYMKMYPVVSHKAGKFYVGDCKRKNLRLKIEVQK